MYLIVHPSDILWLTGVRPHDPGEIMIIYDEDVITILCDARTEGLFSRGNTISDRELWKKTLSHYPTLSTDPILSQTLAEKIRGYGVSLTFGKSPITEKRLIKTENEQKLLRGAQDMNKRVYEMIVPLLVPGVTEEEIARRIQICELELGASGTSFPPIVAFGEHSAIPHHSPTTRRLTSTDIILIDMGLVYLGYCSDMTRMIIQPDTPPEARIITDLVTQTAHEVIKWARVGMCVADLDKKAREIMGTYAPYFMHALGHGVGIDIHEGPFVSARSNELLVPGMVITIEPGIYLPGKYGARYEEMIIIDNNGFTVI